MLSFMLGSRVNPDWAITVTSLLSPRRKEIDTCLLKLALQASIYSIWHERNSRRHNGNPLSASKWSGTLTRPFGTGSLLSDTGSQPSTAT
ncbi:hypothetical protein HID58_091968 [Brassica napus]|uniref:Uncharacterized protein n=1 Tax=Brassica napus TaxID=3708 RepID=A0ABQ7WZI9_BRANA|nr:hypothetical protein HID58_091968 [Brassica napus]